MRQLAVAVAQLGPIAVDETRTAVINRLKNLLRQAHSRDCRFVVFPELALTTFFPRFFSEDQKYIDSFFEAAMPGTETQSLFDAARSLQLGFSLGYAELMQGAGAVHRFNTSILVSPQGAIVAKYRKIHLPGHDQHEPWRPFQHLEKRYFEPGDLGFGVWPFMGARVGMCICNDRRWPETWRVLGLQGAELVTLGYNTPVHYPPVPQHDHLQSFHHLLTMQAGAYQNGTYVAAAAKAGLEEGSVLLGHSCIIAPTGEIIAMSHTQGDELITAVCDFDRCAELKRNIFNFALHRQPQHYSLISQNPLPIPPHPPLMNTDVQFTHLANPMRHTATAKPFDDNPLQSADCKRARNAIGGWPDYQPTPLRRLHDLAARLCISALYYKDEADRFGLGSFKALGGAYAVSVILLRMLSEKLGRDATIHDLLSGNYVEYTRHLVVTCATDGNHGRSVAWGAQRFGCQCVVYIHEDVSAGRQSAIEKYGATVKRVRGNYDESVRMAAADAAKYGRTVVSDTSYPGYLDIPADVMRGYTVLADEALDQMNGVSPTHVFLQGGVGGFAAAVTARIRARAKTLQPRIIVVEPQQAACIFSSIQAGEPRVVHGALDTVMAGLACGEVSLIAFELLRREVDDVMTIPDETAIACMRLLADGLDDDQPLVAGESAVAGLAGLILARAKPELSAELALDENSSVLLIGTEGATDPDVYHELVGRSAEEVISTRGAHA